MRNKKYYQKGGKMTLSEQEHINQQKNLYDTAMKYDIKQDEFEDFIGIFDKQEIEE